MAESDRRLGHNIREKEGRPSKMRGDFALSDRPREVLGLMAEGLSMKETGVSLGIEESTVKNYRGIIFVAFGAVNSTNAVILAIDKGILNLEKLTKDLNIELMSELTEKELDVLRVMVSKSGRISSNEAIAKALSLSPNTIRSHIVRITSKLELNRMQAALLYLAAVKANYLPVESTVNQKI
ncbi:LuxR family transcriptional regulator [Candidatus Roizmanbacteria bacterium]|nr:LuxR family transcriptional regulator [Candidatus Roizmanbacteria bacterium]